MGFVAAFLGLLHMEIIQERLRREYELDLISTYPSVIYRVTMATGEMIEVDNPLELPDPSEIDFNRRTPLLVSMHLINRSEIFWLL